MGRVGSQNFETGQKKWQGSKFWNGLNRCFNELPL